MSEKIRVPIVPTSHSNCIAVALSYVKGTGVVLSVTPMTIKEGMESFFLYGGKRVLVETMARKNPKRLETLASLTRNEVAMRTGRAWAMVEAVAEADGLKILPEPDAPAEAVADEWALLDELTL